MRNVDRSSRTTSEALVVSFFTSGNRNSQTVVVSLIEPAAAVSGCSLIVLFSQDNTLVLQFSIFECLPHVLVRQSSHPDAMFSTIWKCNI